MTSHDDFERRRQARETHDERIVCMVVAGSTRARLTPHGVSLEAPPPVADSVNREPLHIDRVLLRQECAA